MKWLTREWHDRGFSDPRSLAAWDGYMQYLNTILGELNDGVDVLVSDVHIPGAVVDKYEYNNGVLLLVMLAGNDASGYTWVNLTYQGVTELEPEAKAFDFLIQKPTELLQDEIEIIGGPSGPHEELEWKEPRPVPDCQRQEVPEAPVSGGQRPTRASAGADQRMYEHRVLCWPAGELRIRFRTLQSELSPGTKEERATFD